MSEVTSQSGEYKGVSPAGSRPGDGDAASFFVDETEEQRNARWQKYVLETEQCIKDDKLDEAEHAGLRALEIAESYDRDDQRVGITLELLSQIYYRSRRYHYGAPVMMRLLQLYRRRLGQDHLDTGTITHNAALLYHAWRKVDEAGVFYQQAMYIKSAKLGLEHPEVEQIRDDYATYLKDSAEKNSFRVTYKPLPDERLSDALGEQPKDDRFTLSGQFDSLPKEFL